MIGYGGMLSLSYSGSAKYSDNTMGVLLPDMKLCGIVRNRSNRQRLWLDVSHDRNPYDTVNMEMDTWTKVWQQRDMSAQDDMMSTLRILEAPRLLRPFRDVFRKACTNFSESTDFDSNR